MNITAKITTSQMYEGLEEQLLQRMELIDDALSDAADIVHREAKTTSAFQDKTGNLRKSIKKRKSKFEDGGYIVYTARGTKGSGNHAHLIEFGHVMVAWGKRTGKRVAPRPVFRPALEKGISFLRAKVS